MAFTFTVEDGTGLETANAYVSVSFADDYHDGRLHTAWTDASKTVTQKERAIVRATDHVDRLYGQWFRGRRRQKVQALEWPRIGAFDNDGYAMTSEDEVPRNLQRAISEYALRALLIGELTPDTPPPVPSQSLGIDDTNKSPSADSASGTITELREKVGPLEVATKYGSSVGGSTAAGSSKDPLTTVVASGLLPSYPAADMYLQELLKPRDRQTFVRG